MDSFDVVVVGGGMAGVSIAYELAQDCRVTVLDMEKTLPFHTTGRSAAMFLESYGNEPVRVLTAASRPHFARPPGDEPARSLLSPMPMLYLARPGRGAALRQVYDDVRRLTKDVELLAPADAAALQPLLRPERIDGGLLEPGAMEIDVHGLHQSYLRGLRRRGGEVVASARVVAARHDGAGWQLTDATGRTVTASVVVDAAGAWADEVAAMFGARRIGLQPLRRTIFTVDAPDGVGPPMIADLDDAFYLKPEPGRLLCSPAEETARPPEDVRPDEVQIARAIDAINDTTTLQIRHVRSSWAGLRSFVPDRSPVVGYDPSVAGFFWFAAQGGYGIQLAPALARIGAAALREQPTPSDVAQRLSVSALSPARFADSGRLRK